MEKYHDSFDKLFEKIYREHFSFLVKYLNLIVRDFNIAQDLAHDIFLRIFKTKNPVVNGDNIRNYLKKAAKNMAIDHLRKKAREESKTKRLIPDQGEYGEAFYQSLESSVIEGEVIFTVQDVLEKFSESSRKIFIARMVENKTRKQVSEEDGISSFIIKRIEKEILFKLRERLKEYR